MLNLCLNLIIRIAIAFKSTDDWGKLDFELHTKRAEF
jgi:hypothetical protein